MQIQEYFSLQLISFLIVSESDAVAETMLNVYVHCRQFQNSFFKMSL